MFFFLFSFQIDKKRTYIEHASTLFMTLSNEITFGTKLEETSQILFL